MIKKTIKNLLKYNKKITFFLFKKKIYNNYNIIYNIKLNVMFHVKHIYNNKIITYNN